MPPEHLASSLTRPESDPCAGPAPSTQLTHPVTGSTPRMDDPSICMEQLMFCRAWRPIPMAIINAPLNPFDYFTPPQLAAALGPNVRRNKAITMPLTSGVTCRVYIKFYTGRNDISVPRDCARWRKTTISFGPTVLSEIDGIPV
eukprot:3343203-Amphidinium_carterae.1